MTSCASTVGSRAVLMERLLSEEVSVAHSPDEVERTWTGEAVRFQLGGGSAEIPLLESNSHGRKRLSELSPPRTPVAFWLEPEAEEPAPRMDSGIVFSTAFSGGRFQDATPLTSSIFEDPPAGQLPNAPIQACRLQSCAPSFYWCLGTGMSDQERGARWTTAAVFPMDETDATLPSMQIYGATTREPDYVQIMPGFFWKPTRELYLSFGLPVGMSDDAPDWGVLVTLSR